MDEEEDKDDEDDDDFYDPFKDMPVTGFMAGDEEVKGK